MEPGIVLWEITKPANLPPFASPLLSGHTSLCNRLQFLSLTLVFSYMVLEQEIVKSSNRAGVSCDLAVSASTVSGAAVPT